METADVVVVGAGITGCSVGYQLARRRAGRVVVLDRATVASGPTGRSSGIVRQHYTVEPLAAMARDSLRVFEGFEATIGGSAGFVQTGVVFAAAADAADELRETVAMHQRLGIKVDLLAGEDLPQLDPLVDPVGLACAAYEPDGGHADPALAASSFAEAARREGVVVRQRTPVTALRSEGDALHVTTRDGDIAAGAVVVAAGPWSVALAASVGAELPIVPSRHPVVLMQRPPTWRHETPVWADLAGATYFKPEGRTSMLVGSLDARAAEARADPDAYREVPDHDEIAAAADAIARRFPVMHDGAVRGGWAGIYDVTPDWMPVLDRLPAAGRLFCAAGFSGHGFKLAPAVGVIMSGLVLDGECREYDLHPFRFARFAEGRLAGGRYRQRIVG